MGYEHENETARPDAMIFFRINAPACGLFGRPSRSDEGLSKGQDETVPGVEEFESDFVTYLERLSLGKSDTVDSTQLGDELAHC